MKSKFFYTIATLIMFVYFGCSVKTMDENLNLDHAKVGLIVKFNVNEKRLFSQQQAQDARAAMEPFEQKFVEAFLPVIRMETLYDIENAKNTNQSAYQYLLHIAFEDLPDFHNLMNNELVTVTVRLTITDVETQKTVYESAFRERPRGAENLVVKVVKRLPGRFSNETGESLAEGFEWIHPSAPTPGLEDYPDANAIYLVDEADMNIQLKEARLWTSLTKYGNIYTTEARHVALKVLNERGYQYAEVHIPFNEQTHIEKLQARTITRDGRVIEVSPEQIHEVDLFPEFVFFSDARAKKFTFPAVEPGAIIEYMYTVVTESVSMWGDFQFQKTEPVLSTRFSIDVPSGLEFKQGFHCPDYLPERFKEETSDLSAWAKQGGYREKSSSKWARKTYQYELSNLPAVPIEPEMPPWHSVGARLTFSSARFFDETWGLDSFASLGNWYAELVTSSLEANAPIRQKAKELTQTQATTTEKVRMIYQYLQEDFRYVAVALGIGRIVPDAPMDVAQNRYGDCKGLSALMIAMLRSVGIEAYPAILRTRDLGALDEGYVAFSQFNHMIVYVENEDETMWFDPTARSCAFLNLPWQDQGVRALVAKPGGSHLATTPTSTAADNRIQTEWEIKFQADGGLSCDVQRSITGQEGHFLRNALGLLSENEQHNWLNQHIAQGFPQAQLIDHQSGNLADRDVPLTLSYQFEAPNALQKVGDLLLFPLPSPTGITAFTQKERVHPVVFDYPFHQVDVVKIHLSEGYTVEELPEPVNFKNQFGRLKGSVTEGPNLITYRWEAIWDATKVPPFQYEEVLQFQRELASIQQKHIVLKKR